MWRGEARRGGRGGAGWRLGDAQAKPPAESPEGETPEAQPQAPAPEAQPPADPATAEVAAPEGQQGPTLDALAGAKKKNEEEPALPEPEPTEQDRPKSEFTN